MSHVVSVEDFEQKFTYLASTVLLVGGRIAQAFTMNWGDYPAVLSKISIKGEGNNRAKSQTWALAQSRARIALELRSCVPFLHVKG